VLDSSAPNLFLAGILLGVEMGISPQLLKALQVTGTSHIIAINGFNELVVFKERKETRLSNDELKVDWLMREDIPAAAYVISRALVTNPNSIAFWGGKDEKHRARLEQTIRIANLERLRSHPIAAKLSGKIVGVLNLIEWPYCQVSFMEGLKLFPAMLWVNREALLRSILLGLVGARLDPQEPHMHLGPIGVLPEMQCKGIATHMLAFTCAYLDQRQLPVYLETDQPGFPDHLLRPFGFYVTREVDILGVRNWCIWRKPQGR
jgi:hypothetical protein